MKVFQASVMWACVTGTVLMVIACAWFYMQYESYEGEIKGKTVLLMNVKNKPMGSNPARAAAWMLDYEAAFPGCRCAMAVNRAGKEKERALFFCVGFETGDSACRTERDKLPEGVKTMESHISDVGRRAKVAFLFEYLTGARIISPITERTLKEP